MTNTVAAITGLIALTAGFALFGRGFAALLAALVSIAFMAWVVWLLIIPLMALAACFALALLGTVIWIALEAPE